MRVGVDASNVRSGGGLAHLRNIIAELPHLGAMAPLFEVWCGSNTAAYLSPSEPSVVTIHPEPQLDSHLLDRTKWRQFRLPRLVNHTGVDCLFSPGGLVPSRQSVPTVVMSQNALPFEDGERRRYGFNEATRWRLEYLRRTQRRSFLSSDAVIALSEYTKKLLHSSGIDRGIHVIPHGVEDRFFTPRQPSSTDPDRITVLYVSPIERYKHQGRVVQAVSRMATRYPLTLQLVGERTNRGAANDLLELIAQIDPQGKLVEEAGHVPHDTLHDVYAAADVFVFASTCENFPNTLLEAMAAGLPIISTNVGPMPEMLGNAGLYFNLERPYSLEGRLAELLADARLRDRLGAQAQDRARQFTWHSTTKQTIDLLSFVSSAR